MAIVLFLIGLVLVVMAVILPTGFYVEQIAPSEAIPSPEQVVLPRDYFGPLAVLFGVLPFLIPAAFLMSAGFVLRRFLEKE
jgi:hypothetical protein